MGKRITSAANLPDWFDTTNYEKALRLDARGWLEQLETRRMCHDMVWHSDTPEDLQVSVIYGFKPNDFLTAVRATPIFPYEGSQYQKSIRKNLGYEETPQVSVPAAPPGISGITAYDVGSIMLDMEPERQKEFLRWLEIKRARFSSLKNREQPRPQYPDWFFEPLETWRFSPVHISAAFPDQILRQSFDLFVSRQREKLEPLLIQKAKRSNTFLEWCNCGLLQYLDLAVWTIQEDTDITNKALVRGIFPNNVEKGEENIRTTTKKHASIILDGGIERGIFLDNLRAYAQLEDYLEEAENT